jgi:type II secretory pathway component PulK
MTIDELIIFFCMISEDHVGNKNTSTILVRAAAFLNILATIYNLVQRRSKA